MIKMNDVTDTDRLCIAVKNGFVTISARTWPIIGSGEADDVNQNHGTTVAQILVRRNDKGRHIVYGNAGGRSADEDTAVASGESLYRCDDVIRAIYVVASTLAQRPGYEEVAYEAARACARCVLAGELHGATDVDRLIGSLERAVDKGLDGVDSIMMSRIRDIASALRARTQAV